NKRLLHTHHINGVKHDNSASNLICLCADCHRKEPFHGHMYIKHTDMQTINRLRAEQGILMSKTWTAVKQHVDPALHGVLHLAQKKLNNPPSVGHVIIDTASRNPVELDLAWPEHRLGIFLGDQISY